MYRGKPSDAEIQLTGSSVELDNLWFSDTVPTRWQFCCRWQSDVPLPVDFVAQVLQASPAASNIPPNVDDLPAGGPTPIPSAFRGVQCGMFKFEIGAGPDARTVYSDLASGRFALGSQYQCTVYATLWGGVSGIGAFPKRIQSAIVLADGTGDYLPYTYPVTAAAGATVGGVPMIPPGARYMDIGVAGGAVTIGTSTVQVRSTTHPILRDYLTPQFFPSLGQPIQIANVNSTMVANFENFGATALTGNGYMKFWCSV